MKGRRCFVDKSNYRLGRNANDDLCVAPDDSVSGEHACLLYPCLPALSKRWALSL